MDMQQAATFLAATILITIGSIVIIAGIVIVNNILHKYWKPISFLKWQDYYGPSRFLSQEELEQLALIKSQNKNLYQTGYQPNKKI